MKARIVALLLAVFALAGCADSGANAPPPKHHLKPTSNQNPDTEAH